MRRLALLLTVVGAIAAFGTQAVAATTHPATVGTRHTVLGTFLVDGGRTLYLFENDTRNQSTCSGPCAGTWPPLTTSGRPKAAAGVKVGLLGVIHANGVEQVTYAGHPLYFYSGDTHVGDINSQNLKLFGARWFVVAVSGAAITKAK
jgi:predicted lipoprotein with Yx(FWY)xxD motif